MWVCFDWMNHPRRVRRRIRPRGFFLDLFKALVILLVLAQGLAYLLSDSLLHTLVAQKAATVPLEQHRLGGGKAEATRKDEEGATRSQLANHSIESAPVHAAEEEGDGEDSSAEQAAEAPWDPNSVFQPCLSGKSTSRFGQADRQK